MVTIHRSKLKVEFHLVASIVNEVGMEDGIRCRSSKHAIPMSQSTMRRRRLHVIEVPRQHDPSVVLSPFAHIHHILPIIQCIESDMILVLNNLNLPCIKPLQHFTLRRRNSVPSTHHRNHDAQQSTANTILETLLDHTGVSVLKQRQDNEVMMVLQNVAVTVNRALNALGQEDIHIGQHVVRRGDTLDRQIAHDVHGVHSIREVLFLPIGIGIVGCVPFGDGLLNVDCEYQFGLLHKPLNHLCCFFNLAFLNHDANAHRSFPSLKDVGQSRYTVHSIPSLLIKRRNESCKERVVPV